jgi:hypothetical protein
MRGSAMPNELSIGAANPPNKTAARAERRRPPNHSKAAGVSYALSKSA